MDNDSIIDAKYINLDLKAQDSAYAIVEIAEQLRDNGVIDSLDVFLKDLFERESVYATEMEWHVSMPHARSSAVLKPCVAFARSEKGFKWKQNSENLTHMVFMFAVPASDANNTHLKLISSVACGLLEEDFRENCMSINNANDLANYISDYILIDRE